MQLNPNILNEKNTSIVNWYYVNIAQCINEWKNKQIQL